VIEVKPRHGMHGSRCNNVFVVGANKKPGNNAVFISGRCKDHIDGTNEDISMSKENVRPKRASFDPRDCPATAGYDDVWEALAQQNGKNRLVEKQPIEQKDQQEPSTQKRQSVIVQKFQEGVCKLLFEVECLTTAMWQIWFNWMENYSSKESDFV
jgi:hypothetical protein